jgi:molecular chaperone GrpE
MVKQKQPGYSNASPDAAPAEHSAHPDAVVDDVAEGPDGERQALPVPDLEAELQEARNEAAAHLEDFIRARAELENLRKRAARDVENAHKFGLERFMSELLPVKDSIELGLSAAADTAADAEKLREGLELTLKLFNTASEKFGLKEVNPEGQSFDPEYHQAMSMQEAAGVEPGTVVAVVQKGYLLNDRLLRPAMVIVSQ